MLSHSTLTRVLVALTGASLAACISVAQAPPNGLTGEGPTTSNRPRPWNASPVQPNAPIRQNNLFQQEGEGQANPSVTQPSQFSAQPGGMSNQAFASPPQRPQSATATSPPPQPQNAMPLPLTPQPQPPTAQAQPAQAQPATAPTASGQPVAGETSNPAADSTTLTTEQIEQRIQAIEQDSSLTPEVKASIVEVYRSSIADLHSGKEMLKRRTELLAETESAADRAAKIRSRLKELTNPTVEIDSQLKLVELEQMHAQAEVQLATLKQQRVAGESESQTRSQRRKEIRARLISLQQRLDQLRSERVAEQSGDPNPLSTARQIRSSTTRRTVESELPTLEAELAKYDAEEAVGLAQLRTDLAAKQVAYTEKYLEVLSARIKSAREQAAADSLRQANLEAILAAPSLRAFAERNRELAERAKQNAESLATAEQDLKSATEIHETLAKQFQQTKRTVDSVGLTSSVGALLRKERSTLPDVRQRRTSVFTRQALINDAQYELFEYDDERQLIADTDEALQEMLAHAPKGRDAAVLRSAAQELLTRKKEYLNALIRTSNQYFDTLVELDFKDRQIISLTDEYENYIDERVLWIRSARFLTNDFSIETSDAAIFQAVSWVDLGGRLTGDAVRRFPLYLLAGSAFVVLMLRRRKMKSRIRDAGQVAIKANCRSMIPTVLTLGVTLVLSAAWPLVCLFFAWRVGAVHDESIFVKGVSRGLLGVGVIWFAIESLRQVCRRGGLAENHFRWGQAAVNTTRRELQRLLIFGLPIVFLVGTLSASDSSHGRNSVERVAYIFGMLLLTVFLYRLFRPSGLIRDYLQTHQSQWTSRLRHAWSLTAMSVPISLGLLTLFGFYYTAEVLFWRVFATAIFALLLLVLRSMFLRMLLLRRRALSIAQAKQRASAAASENDGEGQQSVAGIVTDTPEADITTHSRQTRSLVNTALIAGSLIGLWCIWVQVLPALGMLDKYEVWGGTASPQAVASVSAPLPTTMMPTAEGDESDAPAEAEIGMLDEPKQNIVTLSDLALAIMIAIITFVLAKNGPGLLEITVLQQLSLDTSIRYAITTLASYAIVLAGTITCCSMVGLQWSQIQWLATALTFGLAFGLQEMFANFVAGLIILLERPIRVGDVVTVDDVTGVVSRIRIRATSITNWDRKEYVVPNKEFITGRLLNWTLSDKVNRIVVNIGVAYGSDTEKAREIMLRVANDHPLILDDPPSLATFEGFGDNSLNLVLRTYLPSLDNRLDVIHQLHTEIDRAFRRAGIEIAFPQRDLHIRTMPAALGIALDGDQISSQNISDAA